MKRLWAPWRLQYVTDSAPKKPGCFFCNAWEDTGNELEHLLVWRGETAFVILNRYPYNCGHLMVVPARHFGEVDEADEIESAELWKLTVLSKKVLQKAMNPGGCNIGINQGKCAGAGVVEHLHIHVVPRWDGDSNFMPVLDDVKIIPQALEETWQLLRKTFTAMTGSEGCDL